MQYFVKRELKRFLIISMGVFSCHFSGTGVSGVSRYWRVNLLKDDSWKIYRNSIYRVTMKDIKTVGWSTPKDAEEEGPVVSPTESSISVNIEVAKWDVRTQNVDL